MRTKATCSPGGHLLTSEMLLKRSWSSIQRWLLLWDMVHFALVNSIFSIGRLTQMSHNKRVIQGIYTGEYNRGD